ncbi:MAG: BatA domain-containing protein [Myxococcota bacterium]|nr:BatA domain-containing protein [Myxococcota bacterium]
MNFLAPELLAGLAAMAIPPILHLLLRRKPKVVRFPALEFILRSHKKTARSYRLRQILLMTVRSLLLGLVVFSMARPLWSSSDAEQVTTQQLMGAAVFVVDASYPMGYMLDGERLIDEARIRVSNLIGQSTSKAGLVIVTDQVAIPFSALTADRQALLEQVDKIQLSEVTGLLADGILRGAELLEDEPSGVSKTLFVFSTPNRLNQVKKDLGAGTNTTIVYVDVSDGRPLPNSAISGVDAEPAPSMGAGYWKITARVSHYGPKAIPAHPIRLEIDQRTIVNGFIDLPAGSETSKSFYVPVDSRSSGAATMVIGNDALAIDNRYPFWLDPTPKIRVLAINGDPQPTPHLDELFYLERAMGPTAQRGTQFKLDIAEIGTGNGPNLKEFDVVLLANPSRLPSKFARQLESFVRAGGGMLMTVGDQVKPKLINERIGSLLPRKLRSDRFAGDAAASKEGRDRKTSRLGAVTDSHPIMRGFDGRDMATLKSINVYRYMLLDPTPQSEGETVLSLDDGAPILLTKTLGRGRIGLLATTIDRAWSDLPIRVHFLPLVVQTMRYLARIRSTEAATVRVGQSVPISLDDERIERVIIETPRGKRFTSVRPKQPDESWRFKKTEHTGHYSVRPDPPLPGIQALPGFSVVLDASGANLGQFNQTNSGVGKTEINAGAVGKEAPVELWHLGLALLFFLLVTEALLLFNRREVSIPATANRT